jgi:hypothetical protein
MEAKALLTAVAVAELPAGVGLLVAPSAVVELLLGQALSLGASLVVARVAGIALVALGLACWLERSANGGRRPHGLLVGLLVYNAAVPVLLIHGYMTLATGGLAWWPVVGVHLAFAVWLVLCLRLRKRQAQVQSGSP